MIRAMSISLVKKKKLVDLHICYFFLPWAFTWACLQFSFDDADEDVAYEPIDLLKPLYLGPTYIYTNQLNFCLIQMLDQWVLSSIFAFLTQTA